jgi:Ca2+-binding RTX toxin-like protein
VVINWGDASSNTTLTLAAGVTTFSGVSHLYLDEREGSPYPVTVSVTDDDGASGTGSTGVTVNNVPPANLQLTLSAKSIAVNGTVSLSGSFTDPGPLDTHAVVVNWGDNASSTVNLGPGVLSFSGVTHQYTKSGVFVIIVTVSEPDPSSISTTIGLQVTGGTAFATTITGPADGVRGQGLLFTFGATGAAATGPIQYTIDWDVAHHVNQIVTGSTVAAVPHVYTTSGTYVVDVVATDLATGASATASATIKIVAVELQADPLYPGKSMLVVGGTVGNDTIDIRPASHGQVKVVLNGQNLGTFAPTSRIVVYSQAGNDSIRVSDSIRLSAWLFAGDGNDYLQGGGGNNVLVGGSGHDTLVAGEGRDLLIGGHGQATLVADGSQDILIGGYTAFDHNQAALAAIMAEWTSSHSRSSRIANLSGSNSGSSFASRLNGDYFLTTAGANPTVSDDQARDLLYVRQLDWWFAGKHDIVRHR